MTTVFGKVLLRSSGELYMLPDGGGLYNLYSSQPQGGDRDVGFITGEFLSSIFIYSRRLDLHPIFFHSKDIWL